MKKFLLIITFFLFSYANAEVVKKIEIMEIRGLALRLLKFMGILNSIKIIQILN